VNEICVYLETILNYIFKKIGVNLLTGPSQDRRAFVSAESSGSIKAKERLHEISKSRKWWQIYRYLIRHVCRSL